MARERMEARRSRAKTMWTPIGISRRSSGHRHCGRHCLLKSDDCQPLLRSAGLRSGRSGGAVSYPDRPTRAPLMESTTHTHTENPHRHDAILKAVFEAASRFLRTVAWQDDILEVLGHLGAAAGASRAFLFELSRDDKGVLFATWRQEWMAPGISRSLSELS